MLETKEKQIAYALRGKEIAELETSLWNNLTAEQRTLRAYLSCHKVAVYCVDTDEVDKAEQILNDNLTLEG